MNPPDLLEFTGDWLDYEAKLYQLFFEELAKGGVEFRGWPVQCRRLPEKAGKWAAFWHLVQEGPIEEERIPDLRRCARLRWIRWVIEHAETEAAAIDEWQNVRKGERNTLLWFKEEYLVVLARRSGYWLLRSAYCTDRSGRISQLRKERDTARK